MLEIINSPNAGVLKFEITASDLQQVINDTVEKTKQAFTQVIEAASKDELIPRKEAMEILNVKTILTMIRWEKKGYLNPHRLASRIFYKRSEVLNAAKQFERLEA